MKNIASFVVLVILILSIVLAGSLAPAPAPAPKPAASPAPAPKPAAATAPAAAKPVELKFHTHLPPVHYLVTKVWQPWAQELEKRTNGQVKVKIFPGETIGKSTEAYNMVNTGITDIAMMNSGLQGGKFPLCDVTEMPFLMPYNAVDKSGKLVLDLVFEKYFKPVHFKDVKALWPGLYDPTVFLMTKKPVRTIADMRGLVIGTSAGRALPMIVKAAGASPETVASPDVYTSLERGMIAGQFISLQPLVSFKLNEVVKYVTLLNATQGFYFIAMNSDVWNKLPANAQKVVDELNTWVEELQTRESIAATQAAAKVAQSSKIEMIELTPEERAKWVEATKDIINNWTKEIDGKSLPGTDMVNFIRQAVAAK